MPPTGIFINRVDAGNYPATMGDIYGHEVEPIRGLKHLQRASLGILSKIVIGLEHRLVLRNAEDATAAMCRGSQRQNAENHLVELVQ